MNDRDDAVARLIQACSEWKHEAETLRSKLDSQMVLKSQLTDAKAKIAHLQERVKIEQGIGSKRRRAKIEQWRELEGQRDYALFGWSKAYEALADIKRVADASNWQIHSDMRGFIYRFFETLEDPAGKAAHEEKLRLQAVKEKAVETLRETAKACPWCGGKGMLEGPGMASDPPYPPPRDCNFCAKIRAAIKILDPEVPG